MTADLLHLEVLTPAEVIVDVMASKVTAEARNGSFTLLPRHIDFVAPLVPGLLSFVVDGQDRLLAINAGVLVKRAESVRVATADAFEGEGVLGLQRKLREAFRDMTESEQRGRSVLVHLETDAMRRLLELEHHD
jgi:F-type H+-transporting ATPase subunit epsilon